MIGRFSSKCLNILNVSIFHQSKSDVKAHDKNFKRKDILELIKNDTLSINNRFKNYEFAKHYFLNYLKNIEMMMKNQEHNVEIMNKEISQFIELMNAVSNYPQFILSYSDIKKCYKFINKWLHVRDSNQMSVSLIFSLRTDKFAEQSIIFDAFLRFYLRDKWEVIRAKYQLKLHETLGSTLNKVISAIIHRGFFRRTPNYDRFLQIKQPIQIMKLLLINPSTQSSLLIKKIMYKQIFLPIVQFYEIQMNSNLYHPKGVDLIKIIQSLTQIILSQNVLVEKESQYLRQLFIMLILSRNQIKRQNLNLSSLLRFLGFIELKNKSRMSSEQIELFREILRVQILKKAEQQQKQFEKLQFQDIFLFIKLFPSKKQFALLNINQKLTPLSFKMCFPSFKQICSEIPRQQFQKILFKNSNIFEYISVQDCAMFLEKLSILQLEIKKKLLEAMIHSIVSRDYVEEMSVQTVICMLKIYSKYFEIQTFKNQCNDQKSDIQTLRVFLFRYISDYKDCFSKTQIETSLQIILDLNDERTFDDGMGNYPNTIFSELESILDWVLLDVNLKQRLKEKISSTHVNDKKNRNNFSCKKTINDNLL